MTTRVLMCMFESGELQMRIKTTWHFTTNQVADKWSAWHFCHSDNSLILTVLLLRHFTPRGLAVQKSSVAVCCSLQAFALHITTVWNGPLKTTKKGKNMQITQWLGLGKKKNRCWTIKPLRQQIIQMWSKKYSKCLCQRGWKLAAAAKEH